MIKVPVRKSSWLVAATALVVTACTEGPTYTEAPAARTAIPPGQGRIAVFRPQKVMGFGVTPVVLVDGRPTGTCQVDSVFFVNAQPGTTTVSVSTTQSSVAQVSVSPGQTSYIQCTIEVGPLVGIPKLVEVNASSAVAAVNQLKFTGQF